MKIKGNASIS